MRIRPARLSWRRGQTLVEFALVLPMFLFLVLAIMEGGRLMGTWISVGNSAREGARIASFSTSTNAQVRTRVKAYLPAIAAPGLVLDGTTNATSNIKITCKTYDGATNTWGAASECTSRTTGQQALVDVSFAYQPLPLFGAPLGLLNPNWSQFTLTAESVAYAE